MKKIIYKLYLTSVYLTALIGFGSTIYQGIAYFHDAKVYKGSRECISTNLKNFTDEIYNKDDFNWFLSLSEKIANALEVTKNTRPALYDKVVEKFENKINKCEHVDVVIYSQYAKFNHSLMLYNYYQESGRLYDLKLTFIVTISILLFLVIFRKWISWLFNKEDVSSF